MANPANHTEPVTRHAESQTNPHGHWGASWRPRVNISRFERIGRVIIGFGGAIVGLVLMSSAPTPVAFLLELLLVAAGFDLMVTGALGHCPLYQKLGHTPRARRSST